ncbi:hypothetical protein BGZ60DRAFT_525325 [Tricladium varicosporioides]|nr:hypothetical protein BGZ60DRAFT_525325 [Hymenoscyphus varicosporioides]
MAKACYALRLHEGGNLNWIYDCQWLLIFAEKKEFYLPALREVIIREKGLTETAETYDWKQPEGVKSVFANLGNPLRFTDTGRVHAKSKVGFGGEYLARSFQGGVMEFLPKLTFLRFLKLKAVYLNSERTEVVVDEKTRPGFYPDRIKAFEFTDLLVKLAKFRQLERVTIKDTKLTLLEISQILSLLALKYLEIRPYDKLLADCLENQGLKHSPTSSSMRRFEATTIPVIRGYALQRIVGSCPVLTEPSWKIEWIENKANRSSEEISLLLRPPEKRLVRLHMSIEGSGILRGPLGQLSFASFNALQYLSIDAKIAFAFPTEKLQQESRNSLFQRIPFSLKDLKIWFTTYGVLEIEKLSEYDWMMNLASNKCNSFPQLRAITVTEYGWDEFETLIWQQPPQLAKVFNSAHITLTINVASSRVKVFDDLAWQRTILVHKPEVKQPISVPGNRDCETFFLDGRKKRRRLVKKEVLINP